MADITDVLASLVGGGLSGFPSNSGGSPIGLPALPAAGQSPIGLPNLPGRGGSPIGLPTLPGFGMGSPIDLPVANAKAMTLVGRAAAALQASQAAQQPGAQAGQLASRVAPASVPAEYRGGIQEAAAKYGVDPALLAAQLKQESGFNPQARSPAGAQGIAQFMPATARQYGVNVNDPASSIEGMARYMSDLLRQYGGNQQEALAAYNGGGGAVQRLRAGRPYEETQAYLTNVLRNLETYRAETGQLSAAAVQAAGPIQAVNQNVYAAQAGLPRETAAAICGPAAVDAFVRVMGRNPGPAEAFQLARDQGLWDLQNGAHGPDSMVTLIRLLGGAARTAPPDPGLIAQEVQAGRMVIIDTPKHYFQITAYNPDTQQFQFGDAVGANRWARLDQIGQWNFGSARTAIVAAGQ